MDWRKTLSLAIVSATLVASALMASDGAPSAPPVSTPDALVQLQDLVREALERNPEIQVMRRVVEAKQARIPQARAWPDPTVSVSYGGNLLPPFTLMNGDPSSARQFMAEQEIPYPGKTRLRGQIATREADAEFLAYEATWRKVAAEVKQAYFDLYFVDQSLSILLKDRGLLERFEKIAEIRYSVGKAAQQDVLKAQVELSRLLERETLLEQRRRTLEAQLNSLRDLPVDTPVGTVGEVKPHNLPYSLDDLLAAAQASFPVLKRQRTLVEGNRLAVRLAEKEVKPNFSIGYAYMQRAGIGDMYGITFTTSLPIFKRNKQDRAIAEAAANLKSSQSMEANELTLLGYRVKQDFLEAQAADRLLRLYSQGILPQSTLALESSLASYETGAIDFLNVLSNFTTVLDYELGYHEQLAAHQKSLARLEELTGIELIR
ncbi:MAG: TolC family protein [Acidobacteria bacterium]|nr:TolC family protein [Acidobacteriota bacterium]